MSSLEKQRSSADIYNRHRFAVLLAILVTLMINTALMTNLTLPVWWLDILMSLFLLTAIVSLCFESHERIFALALGIPSILIVVAGNAISGESSGGILLLGRACQVLFLFGTGALIVRSLFQSERFTFDAVFGAICGYLFVGLGWTGIYLVIEGFQPGSFQMNQVVIPADEPDRPLMLVLTYFSFVTLTTVGYGDVLPITPLTHTLAWMEAIMGQFYLAVVVAGLVNTMTASSRPQPSPLIE